MCKFDNANAPGFRAVSTDIRQWVLDAPSLVSVRWEVEENEIAARMCNELQERFSISERMPSIPSIVRLLLSNQFATGIFTDYGYLGITPGFHHWRFTTSPCERHFHHFDTTIFVERCGRTGYPVSLYVSRRG